jgi:hypothetical protein
MEVGCLDKTTHECAATEVMQEKSATRHDSVGQ